MIPTSTSTIIQTTSTNRIASNTLPGQILHFTRRLLGSIKRVGNGTPPETRNSKNKYDDCVYIPPHGPHKNNSQYYKKNIISVSHPKTQPKKHSDNINPTTSNNIVSKISTPDDAITLTIENNVFFSRDNDNQNTLQHNNIDQDVDKQGNTEPVCVSEINKKTLLTPLSLSKTKPTNFKLNIYPYKISNGKPFLPFDFKNKNNNNKDENNNPLPKTTITPLKISPKQIFSFKNTIVEDTRRFQALKKLEGK